MRPGSAAGECPALPTLELRRPILCIKIWWQLEPGDAWRQEISMAIGAAHTTMHRMSGAEFRAFQATRPDPERWELVKGIPVMMVPATIAHQRIAGNLVRLLNDALAKYDPTRFAVHESGVELGDVALAPIGEEYRPEPDVMVIDTDYEPRQRFVDRAYVIAEIVSDTDTEPVAGTREPWIAVKRRLYLAHAPCEAVILIDPYRIEVKFDLRAKDGWVSQTLTRLDEQLTIPCCGFQCLVAAIYEGTPLNRRHVSPRKSL
jgi:Uma2 family endonuclease